MKRIISLVLSLCFVLSLAAIVPADKAFVKAGAASSVSGGTLNSATFIIDPGHGGSDPGAMLGTREEADDVLRLSLRVAQLIIASGETCALTRNDDSTHSLAQKTEIANSGDFDYFVSIHRNASGVGGVGIESYYYSGVSATSTGAKLCTSIHNSMVATGVWTKNRGVKTASFYVIKNTSMPATLLEVGFIDTETDNAIFDAHFETIAVSIANGMLAMVGKSVVTTKYQSCLDNPGGGSKTNGSISASATAAKTTNNDVFAVKGWTLHTDGISSVRYSVDGGSYSNLTTALRSDVQNAISGYSDYSNCGFSGNIPYDNLSVGSHTITIQAVTKKSNTYTVANITLTVTDPAADFVLVSSSDYALDDTYVTVKAAGAKASTIAENFNCTVSVYSADGTLLSDTSVGGTGCVVKYINSNGAVYASATIVVPGDLTGDGAINTTDLACAIKVIGCDYEYSDPFNVASDVTGDEIINTTDYLTMRKHCDGSNSIY